MGIMFKRDMLDLVLAGKKTQTRRKVKQNDYLYRSNGATDWVGAFLSLRHRDEILRATNILAVLRNDRPYWAVAKTVAAQPGYGKKAEGRIKIVGIRLERFLDISQADAEAEGFDSPEGFFAKIKSIYGDDFDLEQPCWVLEFKLVAA